MPSFVDEAERLQGDLFIKEALHTVPWSFHEIQAMMRYCNQDEPHAQFLILEKNLSSEKLQLLLSVLQQHSIYDFSQIPLDTLKVELFDLIIERALKNGPRSFEEVMLLNRMLMRKSSRINQTAIRLVRNSTIQNLSSAIILNRSASPEIRKAALISLVLLSNGGNLDAIRALRLALNLPETELPQMINALITQFLRDRNYYLLASFANAGIRLATEKYDQQLRNRDEDAISVLIELTRQHNQWAIQKLTQFGLY